MSVRFGLGVGPTTLNRISVTALHRIINPSFISLDMFAFLLVHNNYEFLGYHLASMIYFMPMRIYKGRDLG